MGYTRYNYRPKKRNKRNNNGNFLIMSLAVILIAVVVGLFLGPIIFKGDGSKGDTGANAKVEDENKNNEKKDSEEDKNQGENTQGNSNKEQNNVTNPTDTSKEGKEIFMIQCGYYGKKKNAESALKEIPSSYNKFIIEENKKFRVIAGIYLEEEANRLANMGIVDEDFYKSVLKREEILSTAYQNNIAAPHGIEMDANKNFLSVINFENMIEWGDKKVSTMFLIAMKKGSLKLNTTIANKIFNLINDNEKRAFLKNIKSDVEFEEFFESL